jgi:hypothetical protein
MDDRSRTSVNAFLSAWLVFASLPLLSRIPHFCLVRRYLGIPCPGCGIIHSLIAMGQMHFREAWHWNPAGIALAVYLLIQICARPWTLCFPSAQAPVSNFLRLGEQLVLSALFAVWATRLLHF